MTRSRRRKLARIQAGKRALIVKRGIPVASALLAGMPFAQAQNAPPAAAPAAAEASGLQEVIVTAQKRTENVQNVPISIEVLDNKKLSELNITNLDEYVKYSPSVSYLRGIGQGGNAQPGIAHVYIRGVVAGGEGNHSGPQPTVGTYLDEQPVTTIDGTVDVHIYDIQRIEVLEGPQGTLYGASSESGTVRIITNKPDPTKFSASYDLQASGIQHGNGAGYTVQGFVNIPLASWAAIRLVAFDEHEPGYISNVAGTNAAACIENGVRTFGNWSGQYPGYNASYAAAGYPSIGAPLPAGSPIWTPYPCPTPGVIGAGAINNDAWLKSDYNKVNTSGGRASLLFQLGDNWTVTPTFMAQKLTTEGFFAYDPAIGDLKLTHYGPENSGDTWYQGALTVEGHFSNFDLVYAGAFMKRNINSIADYSDYAEFYDRGYGSGAYWVGDNGSPILGQEFVNTKGGFQKWSNEIRLTTPQDLPIRGTIGLFIQRQLHNIWEQYIMPGYGWVDPYGNTPNNPAGLATSLSIPGLYNTIWLTDEQRVDRDKAVFFQGTWDITKQLELTGGLRFYKYDNTLEGFYGYSLNYGLFAGFHSGMRQCFAPAVTKFAPCTNLNNEVSDSGNVPRVNLTYKFTDDALIYATWSKGFRPGGVNRTAQAGIGPYQADFLTNYEIGWKTQWFNHRLRFNGAFFWENWDNFQFSFLGPNSVNIVENGGNARIKGVETEIQWAATNNLMLSTAFTFLDPVLTQNYCGVAGVTNCPDQITNTPYLPGYVVVGPQAPAGTNLPITPKFKGNFVARYTFNPLGEWEPWAQATGVYQTQTSPLLRADMTRMLGMMPSYALFDLSGGVNYKSFSLQLLVSNVADKRAQLSRFAQTNPLLSPQPYVVPAQPRTFTLEFSQKF